MKREPCFCFKAVIPAKAGIQRLWLLPQAMRAYARGRTLIPHSPVSGKAKSLDSRLRGNGGFEAKAAAYAIAFLLACCSVPAFAQTASDPAPLRFRDSAEERRFHALASELRCVMCQNQSLADSNAMIAHDLRAEALALMRQGKSDAEIKAFLAQRYGEFVLYKPRVESKTWLLWFGPALLLLGGGFAVYRIVRARSAHPVAAGDEDQEW